MLHHPAGFFQRLGALILDIICVYLPLAIFSHYFIGIDILHIDFIYVLYIFLAPVLWRGFTVGKRLSGIRIIKKNGADVTYFTMFIRTFIAQYIYVLTIGIGLLISILMVLIRKDCRSLHDFIAGTYVTKDKQERV
ncbi:RDD family protein [Cytobacillus sp. IB215665]|uniref:RDD family protein n=1 Tax=Cytobacillus sp. IB215665 TaxID=3097357 RepID=UPI002A115CA9|nr:RDD family protein [Cytobacillus sp. IB215665]MDX8368010.1 RDD family protein [Cytobacillus sp. IB215665]